MAISSREKPIIDENNTTYYEITYYPEHASLHQSDAEGPCGEMGETLSQKVSLLNYLTQRIITNRVEANHLLSLVDFLAKLTKEHILQLADNLQANQFLDSYIASQLFSFYYFF